MTASRCANIYRLSPMLLPPEEIAAETCELGLKIIADQQSDGMRTYLYNYIQSAVAEQKLKQQNCTLFTGS